MGNSISVTTAFPTTRAQTDSASLHALYHRVMDGWNQGSGTAFASAWTEDGHLVAFDGTHFTSRRDIAEFHDPLFQTHLKGTRLVGQVIDLSFPGPDVALMHARGGTIMPGESGPAPERDSIQTLVAVNREGRWQLQAFQNTRVRPIGRNAVGSLLWLLFDWLWKVLGAGRVPEPSGADDSDC